MVYTSVLYGNFYKIQPPSIIMRRRNDPKSSLFYMHRPVIYTKVRPAECQYCGRGLEDGFRVSARTMPDGTNGFFCKIHYHL